jgi:SAM-dependent methyltransferase
VKLTLEWIRELDVSVEISDRDKMYARDAHGHYFYVGASNLLLIANALNIRASYSMGDSDVVDILDFGCGHGRVTRWLRAAFPQAQISVSDYDNTGAEWCVEKYTCRDIKSSIPRSQFDLIWLGSVFTHLPQQIVEHLLWDLLSALRPNGVLVFTTQGRFSIERMKGFDWKNDTRKWMHYALSQDRFEMLARQYDETGYGYVDYPGQKDYGVCVAKPTWYSDRILASNDFINILFQEKGSDNHQDVSAFMRASLLDPSKGPLWR